MSISHCCRSGKAEESVAGCLHLADNQGLACNLSVEQGSRARRLYQRLSFQACGDARLYTPMQRPAGTLDQSLKDAPNP